MNTEMDIKVNLRKIVIDEIKGYLTCFREDNDLIPFTDDEVMKFITNNTQKIDDCVNEIYNDYSNDNELHELVNPMNSQVREYLCDFISFPEY